MTMSRLFERLSGERSMKHHVTKLSAMAAAAAGLLAAELLAGGEAAAASRHKDWTVYQADTPEGRVCYAVSTAQSSAPSDLDRSRAVMMVASWQDRGLPYEQVSFISPSSMRPDKPPRAVAGSTIVTLYVAGGGEAYVDRRGEERRLLQAMEKGSDMRIEAVSETSRREVHLFSLQGVTAAVRQINRNCGRG